MMNVKPWEVRLGMVLAGEDGLGPNPSVGRRVLFQVRLHGQEQGRAMKDYPSIQSAGYLLAHPAGDLGRPFVAFDKLDGSNIRAEWDRRSRRSPQPPPAAQAGVDPEGPMCQDP